uniref:Uncharacterized protein n=1 Tax=Avena sativa TaxID=4498 RepID=A0ACD5YI21_AVESA
MSSGSAVTGGSSAGAEGASAAPLGQRLMVHVAENGHSMEFECGGDTPVEAIQRSIELVCGVPPAGQLLLCDNIHLNGANHLAHYNLPRDDREVFLYNKARLQDNSLPPAPESIDIPEPSIPPPPRPQDTPLEVSADPALKALVSYEIRFRYDFQVANAFYQSSVAKYEVCRRLLREWQVQERALDMARSNLEQAFRKPSQRYSNYVRSFTQQHRGYVEVLSSFERDCKRLRAVKLHPNLQCEGRRCLLDLMDENILRKLADEYVSSYKNFEVFVSSLKVKFADLKKRVDSLLNAMSSSAWKDLEALIKEHQRVIGDQKSIMQSLSKDVDTSKKLVDDCSRCQLSDSLRPHDAVSAVGRIYEVHEKDNLPSVRKFDRMLTNLLQKCKAKKNETNTLVHVCVKGVKSAQMDIKDMMQNQFILHEEAIDSRDKEYSYLKLLGGLGHAYKACLAEVVRRRHSFKLYTGLAGQLAEKLAVEREAEIRRREVFLRTWCKYIGGEIMASMGLFGTPSQCDVNITPFDSNLLPIDVDDLERLAPQSLVGSLLKPERSQQHKSQSSDSGTSGNFSNSEQNNLNTDGKMDLQDFFGDCDTVDITGTSILEVENARLKAERASAIAVLCTFGATHESFDEGQNDNVLRDARERTAQALSAKDEYANQLQSMLKAKQEQCLSFEKRIQELEEQLANQYIKGHMVSGSKGASDSLLSTYKGNELDASGGRQTDLRDESSVAMDETSSTSEQPSKQTEGGDENMTDVSGALNLHLLNSAGCTNLDASMAEFSRDNELKTVNTDKEQRILTQLTTAGTSDVPAEDPLSILNSRTNEHHTLELRNDELLVLELQNTIDKKSKQLDEAEDKLSSVMGEVNSLKTELENARGLLDESQINCAHLENCLHEAREEARTNKCSADRRAVEYDALRSSALRIHGLFERLNNCVTAPGMSGFADSLRSLALSLASSVKKDEADSTIQFQQCIKILADKVSYLSRQSDELLERYSRVEAAHGTLVRELEEKKTLINNLYSKLQLEKQASKEKISVGHFDVHELAVFVRNPSGHYEAINRSRSNYFLSEESVALFMEPHLPRQPAYIIGQIVHIERRAVKHVVDQNEASPRHGAGHRRSVPNSNPYGLPAGCEYFVVTVAMLPDNTSR